MISLQVVKNRMPNSTETGILLFPVNPMIAQFPNERVEITASHSS